MKKPTASKEQATKETTKTGLVSIILIVIGYRLFLDINNKAGLSASAANVDVGITQKIILSIFFVIVLSYIVHSSFKKAWQAVLVGIVTITALIFFGYMASFYLWWSF